MTIASKAKVVPAAKTKVKSVKKVPTSLETTLTKTQPTKKTALKVTSKTASNSQLITPKTPAVAQTTTLIYKPIKAKKIKLVRDSFTIPKPEYLILDNLKLRAADLKHPVKKSELLRAGIKALAAMTDANLLAALKAVPVLKSGRPSK